MDLRPELQLKTAMKAMLDVVLPAVDPHNKLAQEQARLVVGMLTLALQHLPLMYRYDRDELSRFLALAQTLEAEAGGAPGTAAAVDILQRTAAAGADVLERARAEPGELQAANLQLRDALSGLIGALGDAEPDRFRRVSRAVTAHAQDQLLRERAWLLAQGWESNPDRLPAIEDLIGRSPPG